MLVTVNADEAVTKKTVFKCFQRFQEGKELLEDEERSGRPSAARTDENIARVRTVVHENQRLTTRDIEEETGSFIWFRSGHADRQFERETRRRKVRSAHPRMTKKEHRVFISSNLFDRCVFRIQHCYSRR